MAVSLVLLVASAAVLVSGQFGQIPAPSPHAGCTESSFSIPSWLVQNVKYTDANVAFDVQNRANNYTASLTCQTKESGWNACSIQGTPSSNLTLEASVQVSESSATFQLNQTWTCSDRGKSLTFTAVGNNSAALNYTSPLLVKGSLISPVAITPAYADGPKGHDSPGCTAKSEKPSWVLSLIHFTDEPGDGASTVPFQNFNLIVTNPATGYEASCMPGGSLGGTPDLSRLVCAGDEFQSSRVGLHPIITQASFDPATSVFTLNQTWFCDDTDAAKPLQINAAGSIALPLKCTTEEVDNRTNKYCTVDGAVTLTGKLGTVVTLPPYSLEDPTPQSRGDGCTLTSIFHPAWQFSDFEVHDANTSSASVTFEMILDAENRGFQYPIPIYQGKPLDGGFYQCDIGADGGNDLPLWPYQCSFKYTADKKELVLNADWACQDLDEAHPVHFSGVTTTIINSTLTCETVDGQSRCATADPGYSWVAEISNVTWGKLE
ncbi:hypothetical protein C8A03DRAFT_14766 [Achaetomium macrosporum]|uniref:Ig-like domain-containing protein n=1 Tax=Achaetomium macrosporum TaxID=79813 RepID=A0AAN7HBL3_9PEZI|nr:hypothetical protein C8A03DRAFT_14766 [Achaetomium macrosporum]